MHSPFILQQAASVQRDGVPRLEPSKNGCSNANLGLSTLSNQRRKQLTQRSLTLTEDSPAQTCQSGSWMSSSWGARWASQAHATRCPAAATVGVAKMCPHTGHQDRAPCPEHTFPNSHPLPYFWHQALHIKLLYHWSRACMHTHKCACAHKVSPPHPAPIHTCDSTPSALDTPNSTV